jgi:hypothetical protein
LLLLLRLYSIFLDPLYSLHGNFQCLTGKYKEKRKIPKPKRHAFFKMGRPREKIVGREKPPFVFLTLFFFFFFGMCVVVVRKETMRPSSYLGPSSNLCSIFISANSFTLERKTWNQDNKLWKKLKKINKYFQPNRGQKSQKGAVSSLDDPPQKPKPKMHLSAFITPISVAPQLVVVKQPHAVASKSHSSAELIN